MSAFTYHKAAQSSFKPPLIANENAFLGDIAVSTDAAAPIAAGFYRLEKGTPLIYEYTYHEMKIIVDGEFDISDGSGQKVHAVKGDVFYCESHPQPPPASHALLEPLIGIAEMAPDGVTWYWMVLVGMNDVKVGIVARRGFWRGLG